MARTLASVIRWLTAWPVLDAMAREEVGFWIGVPTMYWTLLQHARTQAVDTGAVAKHLRLCVSGGAAMPHEVLRAFERANRG